VSGNPRRVTSENALTIAYADSRHDETMPSANNVADTDSLRSVAAGPIELVSLGISCIRLSLCAPSVHRSRDEKISVSV
jgi:hypothetical protein